MQSRSKEGPRPRIGVSLDEDVFDWVQGLPGPSDSYKVSLILRAAMEAGITIEGGEDSSKSLKQFSKFLSKKKSALATEFKKLLDEFLRD
jgi:hypothetical protein